jgi:hypothetical protein
MTVDGAIGPDSTADACVACCGMHFLIGLRVQLDRLGRAATRRVKSEALRPHTAARNKGEEMHNADEKGGAHLVARCIPQRRI